MTATWHRVPPPPLEDEPNAHRTPVYFEPWTPQVGDRVRIRLSGEGEYDDLARHLNGQEGTVSGCSWRCPQGRKGYPYSLIETGLFWWFAAIELEPISDSEPASCHCSVGPGMHWDYCPDGPGMPPRPVEPTRSDRERAVLDAAREYRRMCRVIEATLQTEPPPAGTVSAWLAAKRELIAAVDALERLEAGA